MSATRPPRPGIRAPGRGLQRDVTGTGDRPRRADSRKRDGMLLASAQGPKTPGDGREVHETRTQGGGKACMRVTLGDHGAVASE